MKYQIILEVDANLNILAQDANGNYLAGNDLLAALADMNVEWPDSVACPLGGRMMPGTRVNANRKLIHAMLDIDAEDPLAMALAMIAGFGLNWKVVAMSGAQKEIIRDTDGNPILDPEGSVIYGYVVERAAAPAYVDFLADEYDAAGNPVRPVGPKQFHQYAGIPPCEWEAV